MGQYFHICNDTKRQYLNDHKLPTGGIDWGSITGSRFTTLNLLAMLISTDFDFGDRTVPRFAGSWVGDSIAMYGDDGRYSARYERAMEEYEDITPALLNELMQHRFWRKALGVIDAPLPNQGIDDGPPNSIIRYDG